MKLIDKLKILVDVDRSLNLENHGRPDCKSCALQEALSGIIEEEEKKEGKQNASKVK